LILMSLWQAGGGTILLLAGMNGIPKELYEAAEIDGASGFRQFWSVTFPQLTPVIFFNLIMGIIGSFQVFAQVFILTGGGPDNASQMAVPMLFDEAFRFYHMGYGSAIAWILFIVIMALTALALATLRRWVVYESEVRSEPPLLVDGLRGTGGRRGAHEHRRPDPRPRDPRSRRHPSRAAAHPQRLPQRSADLRPAGDPVGDLHGPAGVRHLHRARLGHLRLERSADDLPARLAVLELREDLPDQPARRLVPAELGDHLAHLGAGPGALELAGRLRV